MRYKIKAIGTTPMDELGVQAMGDQLPPDFQPDGFVEVFKSMKAGATHGDSYHGSLLMDISVVEAGYL